ncbi:hypothetical protein LTR78_008511 [Recurvomyces mirabilis]|uniref:Uncharacterized protein n=1 Tax=Recurvomyces mirabilis TaxID=574656 RepID=A0AAE0TUL3_9PEZI|nr:hypothetical protein LTR78_008511 [Recurvomyces mirabilis]KAK5156262.1 hypothetical protein LTS14_005150 [Recurvomyces mirabilis]
MSVGYKLLSDYDPHVLNPAFDLDGNSLDGNPNSVLDTNYSVPSNAAPIPTKESPTVYTQISPPPRSSLFVVSSLVAGSDRNAAAPDDHHFTPRTIDSRPRKKRTVNQSTSAGAPPNFAPFAPFSSPITPSSFNLPITTASDSYTPTAAASPVPSSSKITKPKPKTAMPLAKITTANGSTRIAGHAPELDTAPPVTARLPPCEMSAAELLYLFPNHTQWPKVMLRLLGSGWTVSDMASAAMYARAIVDDKVHKRRCAAMRYQTSEAGRAEFNDPTWTQTKAAPGQVSVVTDYDVSTYIPRHRKHLITIKLLDVARGVQWWPATSDRGIVSQVVRFARDNPVLCVDFTTDDIPTVATQQGFVMPRDASRSDWDTLCLHNFRTALNSVKTRMAKGTL